MSDDGRWWVAGALGLAALAGVVRQRGSADVTWNRAWREHPSALRPYRRIYRKHGRGWRGNYEIAGHEDYGYVVTWYPKPERRSLRMLGKHPSSLPARGRLLTPYLDHTQSDLTSDDHQFYWKTPRRAMQVAEAFDRFEEPGKRGQFEEGSANAQEQEELFREIGVGYPTVVRFDPQDTATCPWCGAFIGRGTHVCPIGPPRDRDEATERTYRRQLASIGRLGPSYYSGRRAGSRDEPSLVARNPAEGLALIEHPDVVANHQRALRVKPRHETAILVPCAATKPIGTAPSHVHGYQPATHGKDVDVYIVAEPLGVIPYEWNDRYPNDAYDFPPEHLRGAARDALVARIRQWLERVGSAYDTLVLALPSHHMKLVRDAARDMDLDLVDASIGQCRTSGACGLDVFRATAHDYRDWLRGSLARKRWRWDEKWWHGPYKRVTVHRADGRVYLVGRRYVLVFERDFDDRGELRNPMSRWTFLVKNWRIDDLRMTRKLEASYLANAPHFTDRFGPRDYLDRIRREVERDLQHQLKVPRRTP